VSLTRREKTANKETVQKKASLHEDKAIAALAGLLSDRKAPATARARAADILLDRIAGKAAKPEDEKGAENQFERMSEGQLLSVICESLWGLSSEARGAIAETLLAAERGARIDPDQLGRDFDVGAAERAKEEGLPPLTAPKPPRKEKIPRR
jgi:hypothetical protein